jgi:hypothetical protein
VLPRRTAAEVLTGHEDRGARGLRTIELEAGLLPPVMEQELAEAASLDALQELLRDDLVGVDVGAWQHRGATGVSPEWQHQILGSSSGGRRAGGAPQCIAPTGSRPPLTGVLARPPGGPRLQRQPP